MIVFFAFTTLIPHVVPPQGRPLRPCRAAFPHPHPRRDAPAGRLKPSFASKFTNADPL
jgi:hypothetical protein